MTDLSAEQDDNTERTRKRLSSTMFMYFREVLFLLALLFTSYASLYNSMPKIGRSPPPVPFFSASSVVPDFYKGSMGRAFDESTRADVSVVMYYAPWDAESQATRPVFDAVARILRNEMYFAAVNCWAPGSECKQHYPKIRSFPVIVAYMQQGTGIQYKGPLVPVHMIRFLRALLRPITRVYSFGDVAQLFTSYDAVVVGSFPFSGNLGGQGYYTFYSTSLRMLEKDPHHDIAFAVTTSTLDAAALEVQEVPSIRLFLWNETHEFPLDAEYSEEAVSNWVWQKTHRATRWLHPPGSKATTILPVLADTPALFVFSPRNPLYEVNPIFNLVKEISFRYYNCDNASGVSELAKVIDSVIRSFQAKLQRLELKCSRLRQVQKAKQMYTSTVIAVSALSNRSDCRICDAVGPNVEYCVRPSEPELSNQSTSSFRYESSMWDSETDEAGADVLLSKHESDNCHLLEVAKNYEKLWFPEITRQSSEVLDGLACSNNRTLSIVLLDSLLYSRFADGLGVPLSLAPWNTAAIIVDPKAESQYVLKDTVSQESLIQFILNHTENVLERHLRSTETTEHSSLLRHQYPVRQGLNCQHNESQSCVIELHSRNFMDVVMDPTKAVLVMYHSTKCALCRSVSHVFLLISRYLRHFPHLVFARIDGENNDLPWRYTMDTYPTLLFFPIDNKAESRVFSDRLPFTVRNLMHFILANLQPEAKIAAMLSLCMSFEKQQTAEEALVCTSKIKVQAQDGLSNSLRKMRLVMAKWTYVEPHSALASTLYNQKSGLMSSLQFFRTVGLILGSIDRASMGAAEILELYLKFLRTSSKYT